MKIISFLFAYIKILFYLCGVLIIKVVEIMESITIPIDELIARLKQEKERGATEVTLTKNATLLTNEGNSIVLTSQKQV